MSQFIIPYYAGATSSDLSHDIQNALLNGLNTTHACKHMNIHNDVTYSGLRRTFLSQLRQKNVEDLKNDYDIKFRHTA